jgi:hypothetical protein
MKVRPRHLSNTPFTNPRRGILPTVTIEVLGNDKGVMMDNGWGLCKTKNLYGKM